MPEFLKLHKLMFILLSIAACIILVLGFIFFSITDIKGRLISYQTFANSRATDFVDNPENFKDDAKLYFHMSESEISDVLKNPHDYTIYWIDYEVDNISNRTLHALGLNGLTRWYNDLWLDDSSLGGDGIMTLKPKDNLDYCRIDIIVRTKGKTKKEIDKEIKSIGVKVSYSYFYSEQYGGFIKKSSPIYFTS